MAAVRIPGVKVHEKNLEGKFPMKKVHPYMYSICRVKANQVSMFRRRGYILSKKPNETQESYDKRVQIENEWLECAYDDEKLIAKTKEFLFKKDQAKAIKEDFVQEYERTIREYITNSECAKKNGRLLPIYADDENDDYTVGFFVMKDNKYIKEDIQLYKELKRTTKVVFDENVNSEQVFADTPHYFSIYLSKAPELQDIIDSRDHGVEKWHADDLMMDPFQHWLTPMHRIVEVPELVHLMSDIAMMKDVEGEWKSIPNSTITGKDNLPILLETDAAIRFLGAKTGDVVYWENPSIIEQLGAMEFGYCRIKGHTIEITVETEEQNEMDEDNELEEEEDEDYENNNDED